MPNLHRFMRVTIRTVFAAFLGIGVLPVRAGIEIISHRGANMLAPENTLAAQRLAYELGSDTVECDVRVSCMTMIWTGRPTEPG
jgi:glycerophosphoryl diester phosphodiesterase